MAQQGWYPDPSGQAGMFRYWDGSTWSQAVSPTPLPGPPAPPPDHGQPSAANGGTNGFDPTKPLVPGQSSTLYQPADAAYSQYQSLQPTKAKKPTALWLTIIAGVLVLALIVWFVVTRVVGNMVETEPTDDPAATATTQTCPDMPTNNERAVHPDDGWVYGGQLAYPQLASPWSTVATDEVRVPFGRDIAEQMITIHENPTLKGGWGAWVASVLVGQLYAGDGFYAPEEASAIVNRCIFGTFYGTNAVTADTQRSESYTVDGKEGWITETNLSFSIPGLATTSELAIVIIVKTSDLTSSIFYASIPNDAMQYKPDVDNAIAQLKVTS